MWDQNIHLLHMWSGFMSSPYSHLIVNSVSGSPQWFWLVDSVDLPVEFLSSLGSPVLLSILLKDSLSSIWCLAVDLCFSFHWMLSGAFQRTVMLGSCLIYYFWCVLNSQKRPFSIILSFFQPQDLENHCHLLNFLHTSCLCNCRNPGFSDPLKIDSWTQA